MSDENLTEIQEPVTNPTNDPEDTHAYCSISDVNVLFADISDTVTDDQFNIVIRNSTAWVDNKLAINHVPIPSEDVDALRTAASFYSASQLLNTLDHGDDRIVQHNDWFIMATELLDDYITGYLNSTASEDDLIQYNMVKHSHARTYNQKRHRKGVRRWVR